MGDWSTDDSWNECKKGINDLVANLKKHILACDPLLLLTFCAKKATAHFRAQFQGAVEHESPQLMAEMRAAEYVQSVLVSTGELDAETVAMDGKEFGSIIETLEQLFLHSMRALLFADKLIKSGSKMTFERSDAMRTALCMYVTRGKRHIAYSKGYLAILLRTHEDIIRRLYGISVAQVADGFEKLIWRLMLGDHEDREHFLPSAYEVETITGWPEIFVDDLSLPVFGTGSFFSGAFPGWLFRDSPIKEKPFIKIGQKHYAFSYHIVSDYFYRALQFAVTRRGRDLGVKYVWHEGQRQASEDCCASAMEMLLPGGLIFRGNYYLNGEGNWEENDIVVRYCDVLIVIEVKAAAFSHASPLDAIDEIVKKYEHIQKAVEQCNNTESYLRKSRSVADFFDNKHSRKSQVDIPANCQIFKLVVIADNVSEIASCSGSLSAFVENCKGVICLSIDDLMVYVNNFKNNPLLFLYYLKVRTKATYVERMLTVDEMDHLDSFSGDPNYVDVVKSAIDDEVFTFASVGEGCGLDTTKVVLPKIPTEYSQIFGRLAEGMNSYAFAVTDFLLSMSLGEQKFLAGNVAQGISQARKLGHAVSFRSPVDMPIGLFVTIGSSFSSINEFASGAFGVARQEVVAGRCKKFILINVEFHGEVITRVDCECLINARVGDGG